jgi:glyoxylase-like metal-dependent hydrolase (beta-lactamase superfamily II)
MRIGRCASPVEDGMTITAQPAGETLAYPFPAPPETGKAIEVVPGLFWARVPLPFRLNHVNVYLLDDGDGWTVIDTGLDYAGGRAAWEALLADPIGGRPVRRVLVTHMHPDHIGLAGWLCRKFDAPLLTAQSSYLGCLNVALRPGNLTEGPYRDFYLRNGFDLATMEQIGTEGHAYLWKVAPLPPTFARVMAGDVLDIGGRAFSVMMGEGHAVDQIMLHCEAEGLFLAADQVLAKITPNVSVWPVEPDGDPLGLYLRTLAEIKTAVPDDVLVLPGHQLPFHRLHTRCDELAAHHAMRCDMIRTACAERPRSAAELVPVLFHITLDAHQMGFAFSEVMAHVNFMLRRGELRRETMTGGVFRFATVRA